MGCFGCCNTDSGKPKPAKYEEDRSCTDCLCTLLFIVFWGGFIAIASIAWKNGKPERLLYGTDYLGYQCGQGDGPSDWTTYITADTPWQSTNWGDNNYVWFPVPTTNNLDVEAILASGLCVANCPFLNQTIFDDIAAANYDPNSFSATLLGYLTVKAYGSTTKTGASVFTPQEQYILYSSTDFLHRCLPAGLMPGELNKTLNKIPGGAETTKFFYRGIADVANCWRVFLICFFIAFAFCFVYVFIMRFIISFLVWLSIIAVFVLLILVGYAAYNRYTALRDASLAGDSSNDQYMRFYQAASIIAWVVAAIYLVVVLFLRNRIRLACDIIKISGRVMASAPSMLLVPVVIGLLVIGLAAWCIGVAVFIYTADTYETDTRLVPVLSTASPSYGTAAEYVNVGGQVFANATQEFLKSDDAKRNLLFYDLFAFLWTMGFINAVGFFIVSFATIFWYFSDLDDSKKEVPAGGIRRGVWWTLRYHTGTIAFGSCIIAIIQFVRILMNYFAKKSEVLKKHQAAKVLLAVANCCLLCFERIVRIISKMAYVVTCITSQAFMCAATSAFEILADNAITVLILQAIVEIVMVIGKLLVVAGSCLIGYVAMNNETLAPNVDTRILPLLCIAFGAYFIAAIFFNVYNVAVDANFICYSHDRNVNAAVGVYYVPAELAKHISGYDQKRKLEEFQAEQAKEHDPKA